MLDENNQNRFFWNPENLERVPAVYQVYLSAPASCDGMIEVEATSEDEAAQLALSHYVSEIDWDYYWEKSEAEVVDVECENPQKVQF